ncbi:MAG: hypothetical protein AMJ61_15160 [Desulfobacterales bacterium SG8_35_2]|nr:MAG: hypothetical protein AMJ61_15160 [Desulfobacterales bacterium SG8_35_2]
MNYPIYYYLSIEFIYLKSRKIFQADLPGKYRKFFTGYLRYDNGLQIFKMDYLNEYSLPQENFWGSISDLPF